MEWSKTGNKSRNNGMGIKLWMCVCVSVTLTAIPLASVPNDAAEGQVLGTELVHVSEMWIRDSGMCSSRLATYTHTHTHPRVEGLFSFFFYLDDVQIHPEFRSLSQLFETGSQCCVIGWETGSTCWTLVCKPWPISVPPWLINTDPSL